MFIKWNWIVTGLIMMTLTACSFFTSAEETRPLITSDNANSLIEVNFLEKSNISDFAWSPDGNFLAIATDGGLYLVDRLTFQENKLGKGKRYYGMGDIICFSPDGRLLAVSHGRRGVEIFDVEVKQLLLTFNKFDDLYNFAIKFSPDSTTLAIGYGPGGWLEMPGQVKFLDISSGEIVDEFSHGGLARILEFTNNQKRDLLAGISGTGQVHIWNVAEKIELLTFAGTKGRGYAIDFSPDNKLIAVGGSRSEKNDNSPELNLFNAQTGELVHALEGHEWAIHSVAFNADGNLLASASWDNYVRLWDTRTGEQVTLLEVAGASSVGFSPDGTTLATVGFVDGLKLWAVSEP